MCNCNLDAHMIGEVIMRWHQLKIKGNNQYYHMVHGKQFVSSICYSPVYVDRHTTTYTPTSKIKCV